MAWGRWCSFFFYATEGILANEVAGATVVSTISGVAVPLPGEFFLKVGF